MKQITLLIAVLLIAGCASRADLDDALSQTSDLQAQIQEKDLAISSLESDIDQLSETESGLQSELESLQVSYDEVQSERDELQTIYDDARRKVTSLTSDINKLICDDQLTDMKYQNILDASTILSAWLVRQSNVETVQGTYRDSIWSNADTKIHAVRFVSSDDHKPYVDHFLVYFNEFGMKPGVFWVKGQCWLDAP